ncbi:MAG: glycosyltransferase [Candidatus Babeliales bacterium]
MMPLSTSMLIVGAASENPAIYTYAPSFHTTLKSLGYQATTFFNVKQSFIPLINNRTIASLPGAAQKINTVLLNKALVSHVQKHRPRIIFFIKAHTIFSETLVALKKYGAPTLINFYPDNPFVCWNGNSNEHVLKAFPVYDHFLIWSQMLIQPLLSAGCKQVHYFPFAFDEVLFNQEIFITQEDHTRYQSDVCFIGSWDTQRAWWLEHLVHRLPHLNLTLWGNGWQDNLGKTSPLRKHCRGPALYGTEMIKAFRLSHINLNFIRTQNMTSHNMRTFEIPASNAFMLTQRSHEQAKMLFTEGQSIICFDSLDELAQKVVQYLNDPEQRHTLTEQAWIKAHNYTLKKELNKLMLLL